MIRMVWLRLAVTSTLAMLTTLALPATGAEQIARACSCAVPAGVDLTQPLTAQEAAAYGTSAVVFTGTAIGRRDTNPLGHLDPSGRLIRSSADPVIWTFAVDRALHGQVGNVQEVTSAREGASCGVTFQIGARYQVVASRGALQVGLCSRTMRLSAPPPLAPTLPETGSAAGSSAEVVAYGLLVVAGVTFAVFSACAWQGRYVRRPADNEHAAAGHLSHRPPVSANPDIL